MDGDGIDVWVGTADEKYVDSIMVTIDLFKKILKSKYSFPAQRKKKILYTKRIMKRRT